MPEPKLDPQRLAAERAWIAAYPAVIASGHLTRDLIALCSPLNVGASGDLVLPLIVHALVLFATAGFARGGRWGGTVVIVWAALNVVLDVFVLREFAAGLLGAVIFFVLYRVRPEVGASASPRSLRWVIPAALVGVIDVVLPLALGAVTPTRVEDVAPVTSRLESDLDVEHAWHGVGTSQARLVPKGELLVLEGLDLAADTPAAIDPGRRALLIGDAVFRGRPLTGSSSGLEFVRRFGRIRGRVVVVRTGPDSLQVSFEGLEVDWQRARTQVVLRRQRAAPTAPGAPERE